MPLNIDMLFGGMPVPRAVTKSEFHEVCEGVGWDKVKSRLQIGISVNLGIYIKLDDQFFTIKPDTV